MNESSNYPAGERPSISESVTAALRQPSFLRVMLLLAATVVVLVGIRLGAGGADTGAAGGTEPDAPTTDT